MKRENIKKSFFAPLKTWNNLTKTPVTVPFEKIFDKPREASDRYRGLHTNDWEKCVGCGTCGEICPTKAIVMVEQEGLDSSMGKKPERPAVDYGRCSFCGLCVDICVSDSLGMSKEYIHISKDADTFFFIPKENGIHEIEFENGYSRDEVSDLLDLQRKEMGEEPHQAWTDSFLEIIRGYSKEQAMKEAARCVECGVCTQTCPAHMNIPEYIAAVFNDNIEEGMEQLYKTNPLSNVCGRICTHKCESACVIGNRGEAVAIRWLKRYIVDSAPDDLYEKTATAHVSEQVNGKVGIVGAGPAGLAAGYYLRTLGFEVDIYEERALAGGVMRYGIPAYRLPDDKVERDIKFIEKTGVNIYTNKTVGKDITLEELQAKYDAVFLGTGLWTPKPLEFEGSDHEEIVFSTEFLEQARDYTRGIGTAPNVERSAIVIGGGDVSFDVARTAMRLQKEKYGEHNVTFIARKPEEYLAASEEEIEEARIEGIKYHFEKLPVKLLTDKDGHITGVNACQCITNCDISGKLVTTMCETQVKTFLADQVFMAVGSEADYTYVPNKIMESLNMNRDKVVVGLNGQVKSLPWLFAGGDITGGTDVITAIHDGHMAAIGIDEFIRNRK